MKSCNDLYKNIGADRDIFLEISDNLREQHDFQNEISTELKEFVGNLKHLESESDNDEKQNLELPSAFKQSLNPFSEESQQLYK